MNDKPAGTDPIKFTHPEEVCAAITGAFVTGWKAEALRYLAWWTERASRAASAPAPEGHAHDPDALLAECSRCGTVIHCNAGTGEHPDVRSALRDLLAEVRHVPGLSSAGASELLRTARVAARLLDGSRDGCHNCTNRAGETCMVQGEPVPLDPLGGADCPLQVRSLSPRGTGRKGGA